MNQTQAQSLIAYLNRAGLVGAMEGQSAVWSDALHDVDYDDARTVARNLVANRTSAERWVVPGDIRAGVTMVRRARLEQGTAVDGIPDADPDDAAAYIEALRANRLKVAAGEETPAVDALVAQTASALPRVSARG